MNGDDKVVLRDVLYDGAASGAVKPVSVLAAVFHKLDRDKQLEMLRFALDNISDEDAMEAITKATRRLDKILSKGLDLGEDNDLH